jgi:Mrp family chromosome partitioning ATPase
VDGLLVVVAAHGTPRRLLGEALSLLDESKTLGIVFNGDDRPLYNKYDAYYRH